MKPAFSAKNLLTTGSNESSRPATTTFYGDTGLWYVPTAEILPHGQFSASGYRRGTNYIQGYTNVADFAGTFGVGIRDRLELFGSFLFDTRIDRDVRPLFLNDPTFGGFVNRYPLVNTPWTGDRIGDLYVGAKVNLLSEYRQNPAAVAIRGIVKAPTGDKDAGVSTGKADFLIDFIASKDAGKLVDLSGYAGYGYRGNPAGFDMPTGAFRWGAGAAFPSHSPVRVFTELNGDVPSGPTATLTTATLVGVDGSRPPATSNIEKLTRATLGVTFQAPKGFFIGAGVSWNAPTQARDLSRAQDDPTADYWTAPQQEGAVPATVTVSDGKGGTASDTVTIQVVRPASKAYTFEDVYFDFDRYSLRPEATRVLDEAIAAIRQDPTLRVTIEGHTCNIGTAEYNLALGDRRATAVRDYLVSQRLSKNLNQMLTVAVGIAVTTTVVGSWLALWLHRETGPVIVTLATGCFLLTFLRRP